MTTFSKQNISDFYPENIHQRIYRMARKPNISLFFLMIIKKSLLKFKRYHYGTHRNTRMSFPPLQLCIVTVFVLSTAITYQRCMTTVAPHTIMLCCDFFFRFKLNQHAAESEDDLKSC